MCTKIYQWSHPSVKQGLTRGIPGGHSLVGKLAAPPLPDGSLPAGSLPVGWSSTGRDWGGEEPEGSWHTDRQKTSFIKSAGATAEWDWRTAYITTY